MTWAKLADGWNRNPKMLQLSRDARLLFVDGLTYCCEQLTDGVIVRAALPSIAFGLHAIRLNKLIEELVDAGIWKPIMPHPTTDPTPPQLIGSCHVNDRGVDPPSDAAKAHRSPPCTGWSVHDFLAYQPSRSEVEARRSQEREKKAKWRAAKATCPPGTPPGTSPSCPPGTPPGTPNGTQNPCPPGTPPLSRPVPLTDPEKGPLTGAEKLGAFPARVPAPDLGLESPKPKPAKGTRKAKTIAQKPRIPCPPGWEPTANHVALGQKLGFDADRVAFEAQKFLARCERDAVEYVNWNGGFSTWLANARTFDDVNRKRAEVFPLRGPSNARLSPVQSSPGWQPPPSADPSDWEPLAEGEF